MRKWIKKGTAGAAALVVTASILTACEGYNPEISGADNASGAAVSGTAVAEQQDKELPKKEKAERAALKASDGGKWSGYINLNRQSSRYFYAVMGGETQSDYQYDYIYQITPDGKKRKKTAVREKNFGIYLIAVDCNWVYYSAGKKIYRVPIVAEQDTERLDVSKKERLAPNYCGDGEAVFKDGQKLYYVAAGKLTDSEKMVREDVWVHCLDLETGENRRCPEKMTATMAIGAYREYYENGEKIEIEPVSFMAGDYIYYMDLTDAYIHQPNYLYQLNKKTMELLQVDRIESGEAASGNYDGSDYDLSEDKEVLWYVKEAETAPMDLNDKCPYEICSYDNRRQWKREGCTGRECLSAVCKEEGVRQNEVECLDLDNIIYCDRNRIYIEYELWLCDKKDVSEIRNGILVYSLSEGKPELSIETELGKYYKKHSTFYDVDEDDKAIESDVESECVFDNGNKMLLFVGGDDDSKVRYVVYDFTTKKVTKISEKKADQLIKKEIERRSVYW